MKMRGTSRFLNMCVCSSDYMLRKVMQFETNRHRIDTILDENLIFLIFICKKRSSIKNNVKKFPIFDNFFTIYHKDFGPIGM